MDAFAVSICKGLSVRRVSAGHALVCGVWFGGFQALMPLIGCYLGSFFAEMITKYDHWIAFVLLLFIGGKMVDGVRDDEIMFAPERSGGEDCQSLIHLCFSGEYTEKELMKFVRGAGGLKAHLGTSDAREVEQRIAAGDEKAKLVYDAMLYGAAKSLGALAAAADGQVDRIILTGAMKDSFFVR